MIGAAVRINGAVAAALVVARVSPGKRESTRENQERRAQLPRHVHVEHGQPSRLSISNLLPKLREPLPLRASCIYEVEEKSIAELSADMANARITSTELVQMYLIRIAEIDRAGPGLRSIIQINPNAATDALQLDAERAHGIIRGPLHGVPILIKDNIETADPIPTTAGSLALAANLTGRDAPLVARLRESGAVILGKTNLSEWANIRSSKSTSGWSAVGGLTRNPFALNRTAVGSSSGSGSAVSANLAAAAVGTETDGSITCPAAACGIVGLKPTVGLVSRRHVVPISHSQDTAGPMARTVQDAACLLTAMAGTDAQDPATAQADLHHRDYAAELDAGALKGARIGVARFIFGDWDKAVQEKFEGALDRMRKAGAVLIEIDEFGGDRNAIGRNEFKVLLCELKDDLAAYLAEAAPAVEARTLAQVIDFNTRMADKEMPFFEQEHFLESEKTDGLKTEGYMEARESSQRAAGPEGIDRLLREHNVQALVAPTMSAPWTIDLVNGDHFGGAAATLPAVAGYPHLTVPMGQVHGLPVGLSFMGPAWSEAWLLSLGLSFEAHCPPRPTPRFAATLPEV